MANKEIRQTLWEHKIPLWRVASLIGVAEVTLCRWLRTELTGERLRRVQAAIDALTQGRGASNE